MKINRKLILGSTVGVSALVLVACGGSQPSAIPPASTAVTAPTSGSAPGSSSTTTGSPTTTTTAAGSTTTSTATAMQSQKVIVLCNDSIAIVDAVSLAVRYKIPMPDRIQVNNQGCEPGVVDGSLSKVAAIKSINGGSVAGFLDQSGQFTGLSPVPESPTQDFAAPTPPKIFYAAFQPGTETLWWLSAASDSSDNYVLQSSSNISDSGTTGEYCEPHEFTFQDDGEPVITCSGPNNYTEGRYESVSGQDVPATSVLIPPDVSLAPCRQLPATQLSVSSVSVDSSDGTALLVVSDSSGKWFYTQDAVGADPQRLGPVPEGLGTVLSYGVPGSMSNGDSALASCAYAGYTTGLP